MHFVSYLADVLTNFFALHTNFLLSQILSLSLGVISVILSGI